MKLPENSYGYGYAIFEQLPDKYVDNSKDESAPPIDISNIKATIMKEEKGEVKEIQLSLSVKELMHKGVPLSALPC